MVLPVFVIAAVAAVAFRTFGQYDIDAPNRRGATPEVATKARANLAQFVENDDYPLAAIRNDEQGTVAFTLEVDTRGRVDECKITASSGSASLDRATCRIMTSRARFAPARATGNAVSDRVSARIRWVLPEV